MVAGFSNRILMYFALLALCIAGCRESTQSDAPPSESSYAGNDDQALVDHAGSAVDRTQTIPPESQSSDPDALPSTDDEIDKASPQYALVTFLVAINAKDEKTLRDITVPTEDFEWLLKGEKASDETLERVKNETYDKIEVLHPGDEVTLPDGKKSIVKEEDVTLDRALLLILGAPEPIACVRIDGRWRVDVAPLIKARKIMAEKREKEQKPE